MEKGWAILLLCLFVHSPLIAGHASDTTYSSHKMVLPIISYMPETSLILGGLAMTQFKPRGAGLETRSSQLLLSGVYTFKNQLMMELMPNITTPDEAWIFEGRFRDSNVAQVQAEYRQHLWWRFGGTLFAATGEVWNRFEDFSVSNPKVSAGAGLRFDLNPEDTTNIRVDYGIGRHGSGLYVTIGEAF